MAFVQRITECPDHPDCTLIVGVLDGAEVWQSHMAADIDAEVRLNLDYPDAEDHR